MARKIVPKLKNSDTDSARNDEKSTDTPLDTSKESSSDTSMTVNENSMTSESTTNREINNNDGLALQNYQLLLQLEKVNEENRIKQKNHASKPINAADQH